jgi:hypothetical protein
MKTFYLFLFALLSYSSYAQTQIPIQGDLADSQTGEPIVGASVLVYSSSTDSLLGYSFSNDSGSYQLNSSEASVYLKIESMGYKTFLSPAFTLPNFPYPTLKMDAAKDLLNEVTILKKKQLITLQGDKMIYDVDKAGIGEGNNGIEVLQRIPGMRTDKDDNLIFRGDGNLQITINGKPALLSGDALKAYLKTISGNTIQTIEIITNPSARYDAAGTAGIVNIKLKENSKTGWTGNVYSGVGYGDFLKNNQGVNLFNKNGKWNFNAGLYRGFGKSVNNRKVIQTIKNNRETTVLEQWNDWFPETQWLSGKAGLSYTLNANTTLGSSVNYSQSDSDEETFGLTQEWYNGEYQRYTQLFTNEVKQRKTLSNNLYMSYESDSGDENLNLQADFAYYNREAERTTSNQYKLVTDDSRYRNDVVVNFGNPTLYRILSLRADYEKKWSKNWSTETGLKQSYVHNNYNMQLQNQQLDGSFTTDSGRSNELEYQESISAAYLTVHYKNDNWSLQGGMRAEYINFVAYSITSNSNNTGNYLSLFPSFAINRSLNNHQLKLSYSRRIQRPRYLDLNPFFDYIDTYNVRIGNPLLKPQFTNALEFNWVAHNNTTVSLFSRFSTDVMSGVFTYDETTQITTSFQENLATQQSHGLSISTNLELQSWWELQLYGDLSYVRILSEVPDFSFDNEGGNYYLDATQVFSLKKDWILNLSAFYSSGGTYGNTRDFSSYDLSFSVKKMLLNKKLRVAFRVQDFLKTNRYRAITKQGNIQSDWTNRWETRKFSLSLSYNFGVGKKKRLKRIDLNDEENRL